MGGTGELNVKQSKQGSKSPKIASFSSYVEARPIT
jgi:hypothetical protein